MRATSAARGAPCSRCSASSLIAVAAGEDRSGSRIGTAGVGLLLLGHRHHAQGEDLVDLRGVEQIPRTLGRDRRMVAEDDG